MQKQKIDINLIFFTYFLLLNTFIPISLIVSTEIIKMIQGIFIGWDILLYSKWRHCFCSVKSVSIIEELGNVNFIFSDKTGTLTKNQLQFKYCIIDTKYYEYMKIGGIRNSSKNFVIRKSKRQNSMNTYELISRQNDFNRKKNSFLSENNKIIIKRENDSNFITNYQILRNNKSKTNKINVSATYKESSKRNNINILYNSNKNIKNKSLIV